MHARVVTSQLQPGKKDEWIAICRDSIVPALRELSAFVDGVRIGSPALSKHDILHLPCFHGGVDHAVGRLF
jgi:hypothetical protein